MKLSEVFTQLAYGELSQLFIGTNQEGELTEDSYPILLAHVNLGLSALYKRFNLKEGRVVFPLNPLSNVYKLTVSDLNKIEEVLTSTGNSFGLNNRADSYSCFTPAMDTLRVPWKVVEGSLDVPEKLKTTSLEVVYRANHPKLTDTNGIIEPDKVELELPYTHLEALLYFVASRMHNPIGMVNEFNAGNNWAAKYEIECKRLESEGLEIDQDSQNERLYRNGWV